MNADEAAAAVEQFDCPSCEATAGSPCRTQSGYVAVKYHTPRFILVSQLRPQLEVRTPADRGVGARWVQQMIIQAKRADTSPPPPTRIGYARCSTAGQELQSQLDALETVACTKIYREIISTRVKDRPEFRKAIDFAKSIKGAVPHQRVILTVLEIKRLGRGALELLMTADELRINDIELELLTGPLQGIYDPSGHGATMFSFFAGMSESEREYIREKTLEGQASARRRGRFGGRPRAIDADMAAVAIMMRDSGTPVKDIPNKLVIPSGKRKGQHPSLATVYRILAEADKACYADQLQLDRINSEKSGSSRPLVQRARPAAAPTGTEESKSLPSVSNPGVTMLEDGVPSEPLVESGRHVEFGRRWRRRSPARRMEMTCPSCGTESDGNESIAREMAADLEFVWLEIATDGSVEALSHCAVCQPTVRRAIECDHRLCADGPILGGELAEGHLLDERVRVWLEDHGWWVADETLLCAEHAR